MKIDKLVRLARAMHPCVFDDETILHWISELDGQINTQVHLISPIDTKAYEMQADGALPDLELLVPHPYDAMYLQYVLAQFSYYEGEYEKYQNLMQMYNLRYTEYVKWVCENLNPATGKAELMGYYLSAYALAVKHGYVGNEEDWLASLQGRQGERGEKGERGERGEQGPPGKMDETVLNLKDAINGMCAVMETKEPDLPIVALYGNMGDERVLVRGLAEPLRKEDAANKAYVDETVGNLTAQDVWEDIINVTLEENIGSVLFKTDSNGNPFALKEFTVFVVHEPVVGNTTNERCCLYINGAGWGSAGAIEIKGTPKETDSTVYSFVRITTVDGFMWKDLVKKSDNYSSTSAILSEAGTGYTNQTCLSVDTSNKRLKTVQMPCTLIGFGGISSLVLGAGSQIIVRGVRA